MNQMSPISARQESTRSRYPGTRPFSDSPEDQARFFGRDTECEQLYLRVLSVSLLVQFATSGLGKTSLLQASLIPRLRQKPFLSVMVRLDAPNESLVDAVARSFEQACKSERLKFPEVRKDGLWELLSTALVWRDDLLLTPVLVFDQFEEVFTLRSRAFRDELAEELGALTTGVPPERLRSKHAESERFKAAPDVKIVISLREDYLGALEEFSPTIPHLFHERLRLERLNAGAARDAITKPAQLAAKDGEEPFWAPPFAFDQTALDEMIAYLKGDSGFIEPFTLQLLCRHAEAIAHSKGEKREGLVRLTLTDFNEGKVFEQVLKNFYNDILGKLEQKLGKRSRRDAEELCEHGLLDREGRRLLLEEGQIYDQFAVDAKTLEMMGQERLIRRERRQENTFYEISHDRLAESIYASRRNKLPKKEQQKTRMRVILGAGISVLCLALLVSGFIIYASRQAENASRQAENASRQAENNENLQRQLTLIGLLQQRSLTIGNDILSAQTFSSQNKISGHKAQFTMVNVHAFDLALALQTNRTNLVQQNIKLAKERETAIARVAERNVGLWQATSDKERDRIISGVSEMITGGWSRGVNQSEPSTGSKLRMALFAIAAVPQNVPSWNDALRKLIIEYRGRRTNAPLVRQIWGLAFNPKDRNQVAFGDEVGIVHLWNPFAREPENELVSAASGIVNGVAFSPDGQLLAAAYRSTGTVIWELSSGKVLCAFSPNTVSERVSNVESRTLPKVGSYSVAFSPDGNILAVAGGDRAAHLWDVHSCSARSPVFHSSDEVFGVAIDPDGRLLATASGDGTVKVWRLDKPEAWIRKFSVRREEFSVGHHTNVPVPMFAVAFNPMRKTTLVAAGASIGCILDITAPARPNGCLAIEKPTKNQVDTSSRPKTDNVGQVAFSPDGKYVVAAASEAGEAIVSDPNTGRMLYRLGGNPSWTPAQQQLYGVAFSPDSKYLLTGNLDGVAHLWAVGNDEDEDVAAADREALLKIGGELIRADGIILPEPECAALLNKKIPIFNFAAPIFNFAACPLPFLGQMLR